jgi:hypothetical protein
MPQFFTRPAPSAVATSAMLAGFNSSLSSEKVYVLGLPQIVDGKPPTDVLFVGWRYLVGIGPNVAVVVLVSEDGNTAPAFAGISAGPITAKNVKASQDLAKLPNPPPGNYELRVLSIPGLLTDCFWLKSTAADGSDWVVPFDTDVAELHEMNTYPMDGFMSTLKVAAQARLAEGYEALKRRALARPSDAGQPGLDSSRV